MTIFSFSLALVVLIVTFIMFMDLKYLSKEVDDLKEKLERHQKLHDWQDHEKRIDQLEEALELKEYFDNETLN